jgi:hypothetical protein
MQLWTSTNKLCRALVASECMHNLQQSAYAVALLSNPAKGMYYLQQKQRWCHPVSPGSS